MIDEDAVPVEVIGDSIGEYDPHGSKAQTNIRSSFLEAVRNMRWKRLPHHTWFLLGETCFTIRPVRIRRRAH